MSADPAPAVLDASVVVALFLEEPASTAASITVGRIQSESRALHAPDLLLHEVSNALWKASRRGELTTTDCLDHIATTASSDVTFHGARELSLPAMSLALAHGISAYDAAYLALALKLEASLVTGDAPFARRAEATGVPLELVTP